MERHHAGGSAEEPRSPWEVPAIADAVVEAPASLEPALPPAVDAFAVHVPRPSGDATPKVEQPCGTAARFVWVSAHGGAGSTSLARATGQGIDLTRRWPAAELGWPTQVALVCRSNAAGLDAAARMVAEAAAGMVPGVEVAVLVVVADAPAKPSRELKTRVHELSGAVREVIQIPWIAAWRDQPYTPDRAASAAAAKVAALTKEKFA